ncbi:hypothetical protein Adt_20920 [Abeliophyllum distichum]|uniref:C2H2-type domain-containing protein n=1 Tax=Abeliophyllum distichum TaxID=126358 RepID=A0ABD1SXU7_9LAMI
MLQSYFDLQGERSTDEYRTVYAVADCLAANCYRNYKLKAHNHLKEHGLSRPYGELSAKEWQKCIDFITSSNFVEQLTKNKANREETQQTQVPSSGALVDKRAIAREVLEERRGYVRRVRRVLKFAMYKAQLCRMERTISHLTVNLQQRLPRVAPEDDEEISKEENDSGGSVGFLNY